MSDLQRGARGASVEAVQDHLRRHGFDAPGVFGPATEAAVVAFQERHGLLPDGIVGPITRAALEGPRLDAPPPRPSGLRIDTTLRLAETEYFADPQPKDLIVLHHTAGASARSTFNWWKEAPGRIATAYIVERDGTIYELFDPRHWAWHLGLSGTNGRVDRRSIGIEMASEGVLTRSNGRLTAFGRPFEGEAYDHGADWRGHRFFAAYTEAQTAAAAALTDHLLNVFAIPRQTPTARHDHHNAHRDFRGVIGHHHVRPDKTDLHPGFDWDRLCDTCGLTPT